MEKRRAHWPVITAVVISVPALYVLSFGVVIWLNFADLLPEWIDSGLAPLYAPLHWLGTSEDSPEWLRDLTNRYVAFWASQGALAFRR